MRSVEIIAEEHRLIRSLLDCLSKLIVISSGGGGLDVVAGEELLALLETFGDGSHQEKEEQCLFPRLRVRAEGRRATALERLIREHAEDRVQFSLLRSKLLFAKTGEEATKREFLKAADAYVRMQRNHLKTENTVVLPMAERILTTQDDGAVVEEFSRLDGRSPGLMKHIAGRIAALCKRLGVPEFEARTG